MLKNPVVLQHPVQLAQLVRKAVPVFPAHKALQEQMV
jgi:hypothetical protein